MTKSSSSSETKDARFVKFKGHSIVICVNGKKSRAINPKTKNPYVVWFVNNTSPAPGSGTFKSPFPTLVQAQNASKPNDIIYIFLGDGTDKGMNAGISLQKGQQLLGSSTSQCVKTTLGAIKIPAQTEGLPTISNTNSTFASTSFNAIFMQFGDNVVSGLNCVDNLGGGGIEFPTGNGSDTSGGIKIATGLNYLISHNTSSAFGNPATPFPGGNPLNIFGGGNVTVINNTFVGRDTHDTYGINQEALIAPMQGFFVFKNNLFTGADINSGLDIGIFVGIYAPGFYSQGAIGKLHFCVSDNKFTSQTNTAGDSASGIRFYVSPVESSTWKVNIIGNNVTMPVSLKDVVAGINIFARGPGVINASLHKNVSLTTPPTPGYLFDNNGNPAFLQLDMGYDNFGTSSGP